MIIEKKIYDLLHDEGIDVFMERPEGAQIPYALVEKTGSNELDKSLYTATIAVQSYGETLYKAAELNEKIKGYILCGNLISDPEINRVALVSDYNYTDTTTHEYRYQAVYLITYYQF